MAENIHRLDWCPGADDRLDPILAAGVSVALHVLALLLLLASGLGSGVSGKSGLKNANNSSASASDAPEFRQPLVLVSITRPSKPITTTTEAKVKPLAEVEAPPPTLASEQRLEEVGTSSGLEVRESGAHPGNNGSASDQLRTTYLAALRSAIERKWSGSKKHHGACSITLRQTIGGNVASSITSACDLDEADRMALEAAALMAQPLPYAGFESVFNEDITLEINN